MDHWSERVETSPALVKSRQVRDVVASFLGNATYTVEEKDYLNRAFTLLDTIITRIEDTDPELLNYAALAAIEGPLVNAQAYLDSWSQGQGDEYLETHLQNMLESIIPQLNALSPSQDVPAAQKAVTSLRRSVARYRTIMDQQIDAVQGKGTTAQTSIDEQVEVVNVAFRDLESKLSDLETTIDKVETNSLQVTTAQQTAFTKAESDRSEKFTQLLTDTQKELEETVQIMSSDAQQSVSSLKRVVENDKKKVADDKKRVEEILNIVSEDALVGDYSKNAREERDAANRMRLLAIIAIVVAIFSAIGFAFGESKNTAWQTMLARTIIVASFGGLATYAAKQSSEHRSAQRDAERMALQLKALKPYLSDLENKTMRDELLAKVADKIFGRSISLPKSKKDANADAATLGAQILELLQQIVSKTKP